MSGFSLSTPSCLIFAEDMQLSTNNNVNVQCNSDVSRTDVHDCDIEYSDDLIANKIMPSFEPAPSLSA
jgi:hypothetical protein